MPVNVRKKPSLKKMATNFFEGWFFLLSPW